MARTRRNFSSEQKVNILREHLIQRVPVSDVCDKHQIQPTRLKDGIKIYRRAFEERKEELERGTQRRIEDADSYCAEVSRLLLAVDENLDWRNYE